MVPTLAIPIARSERLTPSQRARELLQIPWTEGTDFP